MNILMLADEPDMQQFLNKLLARTKHHLTQRKLDDTLGICLDNYDMVLVDGNVSDCIHQVNLLGWIREARRRYPDLPVAVMSCIGSPVSSENRRVVGEISHTCGVSESADGVWNMSCRLKELAMSQTAALVRDVCELRSLEPIVFEYSGLERRRRHAGRKSTDL